MRVSVRAMPLEVDFYIGIIYIYIYNGNFVCLFFHFSYALFET